MTPFSIQRILVPIDLSEVSLNALDTAVALATRHGAALTLLHIVEPGFQSFSEDNSFPSMGAASHVSDILNALAGAILHTSDIRPQVLQEEGNVIEQIMRTSLQDHSSLIVIGSHGASGHRNGFIGSNAYGILKQAHCPVLMIPPKKRYTSFRKIVFPVRPVSRALSRFDVVSHFLDSQASIDVLGLSYRRVERDTNVLEKVVEEIRDQLDIEKIHTRTTWGSGQNIADDVLQYVHFTNPDLVVITSVLDIITKPNFVGPHTQKIVHNVRFPLLSIKKVGVQALV
jgi:nucleotide-binding universal stress UspA family protein